MTALLACSFSCLCFSFSTRLKVPFPLGKVDFAVHVRCRYLVRLQITRVPTELLWYVPTDRPYQIEPTQPLSTPRNINTYSFSNPQPILFSSSFTVRTGHARSVHFFIRYNFTLLPLSLFPTFLRFVYSWSETTNHLLRLSQPGGGAVQLNSTIVSSFTAANLLHHSFATLATLAKLT